MKRVLMLLLALTIFVVAGGIWYHVAQVKQRPIYANILPRQEKIAENDIVWPVIYELPDRDVQKNLNQVLQQEFIRLSTEANQVQKVTVRSDYMVYFNTHNILSLTITESLYPDRAAHPMTYLKAFTMDVRTGRVYQFQDLFKPGSPYLARINELVQKQLASKEIIFIAPYTGLKDSGQEFYLTSKELVVFYQLYEYTPYVYGFLKFSIPYEQIADLVEPEVGKAILAAQLYGKEQQAGKTLWFK